VSGIPLLHQILVDRTARASITGIGRRANATPPPNIGLQQTRISLRSPPRT